jgi:hypothetical protein
VHDLTDTPRWHPQITQGVGCIENEQLAERHPLGAFVEPPHALSFSNTSGVVFPEGPDQIDDDLVSASAESHLSCFPETVIRRSTSTTAALGSLPRWRHALPWSTQQGRPPGPRLRRSTKRSCRSSLSS